MASKDVAPSNFPISSSNSLPLTLTTLAIFLFLKEAKFFFSLQYLMLSDSSAQSALFSALHVPGLFLTIQPQDKCHVFREVFPENSFYGRHSSPPTHHPIHLFYMQQCEIIFWGFLLGYFLIIHLEYKVSEGRDIIFHTGGIRSTLTTRSSAL